jgi:hypothetical protein
MGMVEQEGGEMVSEVRARIKKQKIGGGRGKRK